MTTLQVTHDFTEAGMLGEVAVLAEDFADVPADEILTAATVGGARALGLRHHPHVRIPWSRLGFLVPREPVAHMLGERSSRLSISN